MIGLTQAQSELLDFIKQHMAENEGVSPSFDEMREALGLASKSGVHRLVCSLEERGFIRRLANRARALEVVDPESLPVLDKYSSRALIAELAKRGATRRLVRNLAA